MCLVKYIFFSLLGLAVTSQACGQDTSANSKNKTSAYYRPVISYEDTSIVLPTQTKNKQDSSIKNQTNPNKGIQDVMFVIAGKSFTQEEEVNIVSQLGRVVLNIYSLKKVKQVEVNWGDGESELFRISDLNQKKHFKFIDDEADGSWAIVITHEYESSQNSNKRINATATLANGTKKRFTKKIKIKYPK